MAPVMAGRASGTSSSPARWGKAYGEQQSAVSLVGSTVAVGPSADEVTEVPQQPAIQDGAGGDPGFPLFASLPESVLLNIFQVLHDENRALLMHPSAVNQQWRRLAYEVLLFDTAASRPARHVPLASVQENPVTAGAANGAASPCFSSGSVGGGPPRGRRGPSRGADQAGGRASGSGAPAVGASSGGRGPARRAAAQRRSTRLPPRAPHAAANGAGHVGGSAGMAASAGYVDQDILEEDGDERVQVGETMAGHYFEEGVDASGDHEAPPYPALNPGHAHGNNSPAAAPPGASPFAASAAALGQQAGVAGGAAAASPSRRHHQHHHQQQQQQQQGVQMVTRGRQQLLEGRASVQGAAAAFAGAAVLAEKGLPGSPAMLAGAGHGRAGYSYSQQVLAAQNGNGVFANGQPHSQRKRARDPHHNMAGAAALEGAASVGAPPAQLPEGLGSPTLDGAEIAGASSHAAVQDPRRPMLGQQHRDAEPPATRRRGMVGDTGAASGAAMSLRRSGSNSLVTVRGGGGGVGLSPPAGEGAAGATYSAQAWLGGSTLNGRVTAGLGGRGSTAGTPAASVQAVQIGLALGPGGDGHMEQEASMGRPASSTRAQLHVTTPAVADGHDGEVMQAPPLGRYGLAMGGGRPLHQVASQDEVVQQAHTASAGGEVEGGAGMGGLASPDDHQDHGEVVQSVGRPLPPPLPMAGSSPDLGAAAAGLGLVNGAPVAPALPAVYSTIAGSTAAQSQLHGELMAALMEVARGGLGLPLPATAPLLLPPLVTGLGLQLEGEGEQMGGAGAAAAVGGGAAGGRRLTAVSEMVTQKRPTTGGGRGGASGGGAGGSPATHSPPQPQLQGLPGQHQGTAHPQQDLQGRLEEVVNHVRREAMSTCGAPAPALPDLPLTPRGGAGSSRPHQQQHQIAAHAVHPHVPGAAPRVQLVPQVPVQHPQQHAHLQGLQQAQQPPVLPPLYAATSQQGITTSPAGLVGLLPGVATSMAPPAVLPLATASPPGTAHHRGGRHQQHQQLQSLPQLPPHQQPLVQIQAQPVVQAGGAGRRGRAAAAAAGASTGGGGAGRAARGSAAGGAGVVGASLTSDGGGVARSQVHESAAQGQGGGQERGVQRGHRGGAAAAGLHPQQGAAGPAVTDDALVEAMDDTAPMMQRAPSLLAPLLSEALSVGPGPAVAAADTLAAAASSLALQEEAGEGGGEVVDEGAGGSSEEVGPLAPHAHHHHHHHHNHVQGLMVQGGPPGGIPVPGDIHGALSEAVAMAVGGGQTETTAGGGVGEGNNNVEAGAVVQPLPGQLAAQGQHGGGGGAGGGGAGGVQGHPHNHHAQQAQQHHHHHHHAAAAHSSLGQHAGGAGGAAVQPTGSATASDASWGLWGNSIQALQEWVRNARHA